jgi:ATP-binding cassette subfamily F protein uup
MEYTGTLMIVSHDRSFLNNVVTSTIVMEGQGEVYEYAGGYDDWLSQRSMPIEAVTSAAKETPQPAPAAETKDISPRALSTKEEAELRRLPALIEKLENEVVKHSAENAPAKAAQAAEELKRAYARWARLEKPPA